jgi:UDP-N-acetylglucosamine 2-epimerase (hydrolysing)
VSHIHFVSNEEAAQTIETNGRNQGIYFTIGSPDIDIMFSEASSLATC